MISIATIPPIERPASANCGGAWASTSAASAAVLSCPPRAGTWIARAPPKAAICGA